MSADSLRVLVVDDEPPIGKLLRMSLNAHGYHVLQAQNGKTALNLLGQAPDLIILDLGLPDIQGHELLRMIRARNESVPIVVLSSRDDEAGKVRSFNLGADDYVTKPFGMDELLARIRAALRHRLQTHGERPIFRVGDLSVDLVRRIVKVGEREIKLTPKEYELLCVLVQHAGKVLTHKFLLGELWDDLADAQNLRVYVRQLRKKIEGDPERPQYILTETGIGYRLRAPMHVKYSRAQGGITSHREVRQKSLNRSGASSVYRTVCLPLSSCCLGERRIVSLMGGGSAAKRP
jgi:two-component system, OmpR family, KDP operon response regulator KdpE